MASGVVFASTLLLDLDRRELKVPTRRVAHRAPQASSTLAS